MRKLLRRKRLSCFDEPASRADTKGSSNLRQTKARSERLKHISVQRSTRVQKELKQTEQRYMLLSMDHQANSVAARVKYEELGAKLRVVKVRAKEVDTMYARQSEGKAEALREVARLKAQVELTQAEKRTLWAHINTLNSAWGQEMRVKEAQRDEHI